MRRSASARERIPSIVADLRARFKPGAGTAIGDFTALGKITVETEDPFRVLISTILSQRTRDGRTAEASSRLFSRYATAGTLARAHVREIERLIRPAGFYRQKARKIKEVARILVRDHAGAVPADYDALLALPQVGPKTANCVLVYGYGLPALPVDTHVHRISNRLGLVRTRTPEQTEAALRRVLPREYWLDFNELLVRFGQVVCKPIGPRCAECSFPSFCRYYATTVSRKRGSRAQPKGRTPPSRSRAD